MIDVPESPARLTPHGRVAIPGFEMPSYRTAFAVQSGVEKNLILRTWGGLGDQVCAEPTLRYALKAFPNCDVYLATERPELFTHLKFKRVFDTRDVLPRWENYLCFNTILDQSALFTQFASHMLMNCVDYCSIAAFRMQMPVADRQVKLVPLPDDCMLVENLMVRFDGMPYALVHAGKHWPSKTFPVDWWDAVLADLNSRGIMPVLIGADLDDNRTTVEVDARQCLDLRGKLSVMQTVALIRRSQVLLTNDSAPLHLGAPSDCWIGFIATCKHPDMISHWRRGGWSWRMENLGLGGIWEVVDHCPNQTNEVSGEFVDAALLRSWLPDPQDVAAWAQDKMASMRVAAEV